MRTRPLPPFARMREIQAEAREQLIVKAEAQRAADKEAEDAAKQAAQEQAEAKAAEAAKAAAEAKAASDAAALEAARQAEAVDPTAPAKPVSKMNKTELLAYGEELGLDFTGEETNSVLRNAIKLKLSQ